MLIRRAELAGFGGLFSVHLKSELGAPNLTAMGICGTFVSVRKLDISHLLIRVVSGCADSAAIDYSKLFYGGCQ